MGRVVAPTGRGHGPLLPDLGGSGAMGKEVLFGDFDTDTDTDFDTDSLFAPSRLRGEPPFKAPPYSGSPPATPLPCLSPSSAPSVPSVVNPAFQAEPWIGIGIGIGIVTRSRNRDVGLPPSVSIRVHPWIHPFAGHRALAAPAPWGRRCSLVSSIPIPREHESTKWGKFWWRPPLSAPSSLAAKKGNSSYRFFRLNGNWSYPFPTPTGGGKVRQLHAEQEKSLFSVILATLARYLH